MARAEIRCDKDPTELRLFVDGREVPDVVGYTIDHPDPELPATLTIKVLVTELVAAPLRDERPAAPAPQAAQQPKPTPTIGANREKE